MEGKEDNNLNLNDIRSTLKLNALPWIDIPDDLLEMAFRPSNVYISSNIIGNKSFSIKTCADVFEAIIGAMTYFLLYIKDEPKYMSILQKYLEDNFYTNEVIKNLIEKDISLDLCKISNNLTASEAGKEHIVYKRVILFIK